MKAILTLCLAACSFCDIYAQEVPGPERSAIELDTDMAMFAAPSTSFFLGWQRDVNALFQIGLDGLSGCFGGHDRRLLRFGMLTLFTGASLIANRAFSLTAHDESHMEAARAIGASGVSLARETNSREMSIWEFFFESFNFTLEPGLYEYTKVNATLNEQAYVAGEGLNTNMLTADAIGRKIDEGAGHITDLAPYLLNKLWGVSYFLETGPHSDGANYVDLLIKQGHNTVSSRSVVSLNAVSCLLSGGFLALARGTYDFIAEGTSAVKPLGLRIGEVTLCWPELTTWLNPDNVSLLVSADAAWKNIAFFRFGIDSPLLGNTSANPELTFGVKVKIQRLRVGTEITSHFTGLPFFLGSAELLLADIFSIGIEGFYGERHTMRELREYPLGPGAAGFVKVMF
ncbi:MAG TPA: hypothetical protein VMU36_08050 [Spirochaetia bacterium]|nr:hypothetical protein [Spirochaetia bacterium]